MILGLNGKMYCVNELIRKHGCHLVYEVYKQIIYSIRRNVKRYHVDIRSVAGAISYHEWITDAKPETE